MKWPVVVWFSFSPLWNVVLFHRKKRRKRRDCLSLLLQLWPFLLTVFSLWPALISLYSFSDSPFCHLVFPCVCLVREFCVLVKFHPSRVHSVNKVARPFEVESYCWLRATSSWNKILFVTEMSLTFYSFKQRFVQLWCWKLLSKRYAAENVHAGELITKSGNKNAKMKLKRAVVPLAALSYTGFLFA